MRRLKSYRRGIHTRRVLLPAMPHDEVAADPLASSHFDGTYDRAAISAVALCGVRRNGSLRQAVAIGGRVGEAARA
jgi:hypothetical protein